MKKYYPLLALLSLSLVSCGGSSSSSTDSSSPSNSSTPAQSSTPSPTNPASSSTSSQGDYYSDVEQRAKFDPNSELSFRDDFSNGIRDDVFYIIDAKWDAGGTKPHNGVRKRNIFYTEDEEHNKYVAIKGRGLYNTDEGTIDGSPEGACFITKNHLGPGRYEIKMAAMPREGGITAFWTYCTTTGSEATSQNEIDIEIGGSTNGTHYQNLWATTWTTHTNKQTKAPDVTEFLYMNDGMIHTYTFDWYTSYPTNHMPRIDWFIDGHLVSTIDNDAVPTHDMPLWIGLWFQSWAGNPEFDTDYLLIDEVSYQAFEEKQIYTKCRTNPGYSKFVPSSENVQTIPMSTITGINKLSNGSFKHKASASDGSLYGWFEDTASSGSYEVVSEGSTNLLKLTAGADNGETYHGEYMNQTITEAYPGFKYSFKVDAKKANDNSSGQIIIYYLNKAGGEVKTDVINVDSTTLKTYTKEILVPKKTQKIKIEYTADDGSVLFTNSELIYKGFEY